MNYVKQIVAKLAVVTLCFGLAFPNVAMAQKGKKANKAKTLKPTKVVKPAKGIKAGKKGLAKKKVDNRTLGRQYVQAMLTGTGPMAKKLKMKSKLTRKGIMQRVKANRKGNVKGLKAKLTKLNLKKGANGLSKLSMKDKKLNSAIQDRLKSKDFNKVLEKGFQNLDKLLPKDMYDRIGAEIHKGDRAALAKLTAELAAQIKGGTDILNPDDLKQNGEMNVVVVVETAVAVALVLVIVLIDFNFKAEDFAKMGNDKFINNVVQTYQIR